jgi:asparagine synthase (glutamine-hydrolysing)
MCGFVVHSSKSLDLEALQKAANTIQYRGPDNTTVEKLTPSLGAVFHRLSIIDVSENGNQPLHHPRDENLSLVCNGEIYNYQDLIEENSFEMKSSSDCEVILHLYKKFGIEKTISMLDGVFAFVLSDGNKNEWFIGRDPYGVRPAFFGWKDEFSSISVASEAKAILGFTTSIIQFPPGSWWSSDLPRVFTAYCAPPLSFIRNSEPEICEKINQLLSESVVKRLMSEREIGCLLSGGLDSSLIASLVKKYSSQKKLATFSIGMEGSPDLYYAKRVANYIESDHHNIQLKQQDFLDAIETVIYNIESYDTTTVRASVGNYLVSKYIRENTEVKVVFNGDGADEVCMGYVYNQNAPTSDKFQEENRQLLSEIHYFDVLRSDRSISSNGLEARTPFLDKTFVDFYMSIPTELKMFGNDKMEKYLLRKSFENDDLLPKEILWRNKCAFSDGVSSVENSWHKTLQNFIDSKISDEEFKNNSKLISHCTPLLKESYFYRKIYDSMFPDCEMLIPKFWMPKWTDTIDPSARELKNYKE